jgi:cytochrome c oxidase subunit 1
MAIAVPTGIKIFNWIGTMWRGSIELKTPMLFAIGFIFMFIVGGLSGVMHSSAASDAQQQDTYFVVAHLHYVLFGGSIFALMAGAYYWFPKVTGRLMNERTGKLHFWLTFIGFNLTFFPMHFLGLNGMPRRIYTYDPAMGWDLWNAVSSAGSAIIAVSVLVFIYNLIQGARKGEAAGADPWDARTLEWSISSPPPEYNFELIPTVHGRDPFWAQKREGVRAVPVAGGSGEGGAHSVHLPQPSYWPLVVPMGLLMAGYGLLSLDHIVGLAVTSLGAAIAMVGIYAWALEPVNDPDEDTAH